MFNNIMWKMVSDEEEQNKISASRQMTMRGLKVNPSQSKEQ
jgi:hypothetical protein